MWSVASPKTSLPRVIITPVPLMMRATVAEEKPSEVNSTDRWEKPGLAKAPINRLAQPRRSHIWRVITRWGPRLTEAWAPSG